MKCREIVYYSNNAKRLRNDLRNIVYDNKNPNCRRAYVGNFTVIRPNDGWKSTTRTVQKKFYFKFWNNKLENKQWRNTYWENKIYLIL